LVHCESWDVKKKYVFSFTFVLNFLGKLASMTTNQLYFVMKEDQEGSSHKKIVNIPFKYEMRVI